MSAGTISQQEQIRRLFVKGTPRATIAKKLGIRYQIVFKATNVKYAPKSWAERIANAHKGTFVTTAKRTPRSKAPQAPKVTEVTEA
jgi:DNA invertase Pin-like site-specific DNA recombinase